MKVEISFLFLLIHFGCAKITTEYQNLQMNGSVKDLEMFQCLLKANGIQSCAIRMKTSTNHVLNETNRCQLLPPQWCWTRTVEPGYTYVEKHTVLHTPPYTIHVHNDPITYGIWEHIPILVEPGVELAVTFTPPSSWSMVRLDLYDGSERMIYKGSFFASFLVAFLEVIPNQSQIGLASPVLQSGKKSTIRVSFDNDSILIYVDGILCIDYVYTQDPRYLRILQFVFFDNPGDIHRVSYKAATW